MGKPREGRCLTKRESSLSRHDLSWSDDRVAIIDTDDLIACWSDQAGYRCREQQSRVSPSRRSCMNQESVGISLAERLSNMPLFAAGLVSGKSKPRRKVFNGQC